MPPSTLKNTLLCLLVLCAILSLSLTRGVFTVTAATPVAEVLHNLGQPPAKHYIQADPALAKKGEEIVLTGRTTNADGRRTNFVSKYYSCTSCHNIEQEDPDLRFSDPEARLPYVKQKGLPFLQGTTFKGIVNRESWYNDDYVKKYGDEKIKVAHESLRESIQLCAVECSQGREMEDWEIEAVLAYYWTLQFTLGDLGLTDEELERINTESSQPEKQAALRTWLRGFYGQTSPAHFYDAPPSKREGYPGLTGDPRRGKDLYELSCLHCHKAGGVSHYPLGNDKLSFRHLRKMIIKDSHFSLYQIVAYGTYAIPGHRPYMPHYPAERMSKQQVEDLRAYIELMAH
ncbi:c-type cytochrome [Neolewinella persica]|uniref:c-type cytochrome n=1 Tax=Neolewinella persica TaxID=70998 RepID=UPI0012FA026D|nr:cytochrome c [Neolewinella persica]